MKLEVVKVVRGSLSASVPFDFCLFLLRRYGCRLNTARFLLFGPVSARSVLGEPTPPLSLGPFGI